MVTPDLIAVVVGWKSGTIRGRFVYDRVTAAAWEIVREVESYVIADFPADRPTDFVARSGAESSSREFENDEEWWAYRRRDP